MSEALEHVTVFFTPASSRALRRAAEITGDGLTDVINRAVQTYAMFADDVASGGSVVVRYGDSESVSGDLDQAPAGDVTHTSPDLHGLVLDALSAGQGPLLPLPAETTRILAARVTDAVTPLVPYRPVWDGSLPPGGEVCSICGQPVESEPCTEHAPAAPTNAALSPLQVAEWRQSAEALMDKCRRRQRASLADVEQLKKGVNELAGEAARLVAALAAAHRRIDEAVEFLATCDTAGWSDDAIGLGLDVVAHLDGPGPRASDGPAMPPALPWTGFLTDLGVSDLVGELADTALDHYRPDGGSDRELLARLDGVLARSRAAARREVE